MHYAMTADGKRVEAKDGTRWSTYYCPACGGEVNWIPGSYARSHFRHQRDSFAFGCPLYNPNGFWNGLYLGARYNRPTPPWAKFEVHGSDVQSESEPSTPTNKAGVRPFVWDPAAKDKTTKNASLAQTEIRSSSASLSGLIVSGEKTQEPNYAAQLRSCALGCGVLILSIGAVAFFAARSENFRNIVFFGLFVLVYYAFRHIF